MSRFLQQAEAALGMSGRPWGLAGAFLLLLYALQAELRFGARARSSATGAADRGSTLALSLAAAVPIVGFVLAVKAPASVFASWLPAGIRGFATLPGMPASAWLGVALGFAGLALRLWAVLTLRERYTRTLLVHEQHAFERGGPYRFVRHPGYLGSLLCLNGLALASGNTIVALASVVLTLAAYAHRIAAEDAMLVATFGEPYERYRREVGALLPRLR